MAGMTVGVAAERTGWSPRMLRYLEATDLVVPARTRGGYRVYGIRELNQLAALREMRRRFAVEIGDVAFVARMRREPQLRAALETWLHGSEIEALDWEQRKHEQLLAA